MNPNAIIVPITVKFTLLLLYCILILLYLYFGYKPEYRYTHYTEYVNFIIKLHHHTVRVICYSLQVYSRVVFIKHELLRKSSIGTIIALCTLPRNWQCRFFFFFYSVVITVTLFILFHRKHIVGESLNCEIYTR